MRVDRAREAALDVLAACRRNGAWIDGALKQVLKRDGLSGRDAAFASRIAYGVMQSRIYLDRCLTRCLTQRPEKLEPLLLNILRIGAYQILFMDKVPVNAAVNEAVEMAKAHKLSRAAGLVNAVLRNVDRRKGEPLAFADELEALSVQTSHPRALVERMVGLLGAEEAEAFLRADNEPVPTTIQTNTLKTTAKRLRAARPTTACSSCPSRATRARSVSPKRPLSAWICPMTGSIWPVRSWRASSSRSSG